MAMSASDGGDDGRFWLTARCIIEKRRTLFPTPTRTERGKTKKPATFLDHTSQFKTATVQNRDRVKLVEEERVGDR